MCAMAPETTKFVCRSISKDDHGEENRNRIRHSVKNLAAVYSFIFNCILCLPMKFDDCFLHLVLTYLYCTSMIY